MLTLLAPSLRGYLTKYDCSSADINPIGAISKTDLKAFIAYAEGAFNLPILAEWVFPSPLPPFVGSRKKLILHVPDSSMRSRLLSFSPSLRPTSSPTRPTWSVLRLHQILANSSSPRCFQGMTYDELSVYGRLRKNEKLGPYGMFTRLASEWGNRLSPLEVRCLPCGPSISLTRNCNTDCGEGQEVLLRIRA